jgi:hypothetical protein
MTSGIPEDQMSSTNPELCLEWAIKFVHKKWVDLDIEKGEINSLDDFKTWFYDHHGDKFDFYILETDLDLFDSVTGAMLIDIDISDVIKNRLVKTRKCLDEISPTYRDQVLREHLYSTEDVKNFVNDQIDNGFIVDSVISKLRESYELAESMGASYIRFLEKP